MVHDLHLDPKNMQNTQSYCFTFGYLDPNTRTAVEGYSFPLTAVRSALFWRCTSIYRKPESSLPWYLEFGGQQANKDRIHYLRGSRPPGA